MFRGILDNVWGGCDIDIDVLWFSHVSILRDYCERIARLTSNDEQSSNQVPRKTALPDISEGSF